MMPRIVTKTNGENHKPKWEADDEQDKLAEKLAELPALPPQTPSGTTDIKPPVLAKQPEPPKRPTTIDPVHVINVLLDAWTNDAFHVHPDGSDLVLEKYTKTEDGRKFKNIVRVRFAAYSETKIPLLK